MIMNLSVFSRIEELEKEVDAIKERLLNRGATHGEDSVHADEAEKEENDGRDYERTEFKAQFNS